MAARGGRFGRGGRGRGRGFPVVRDEDGMALVPKNRDGPPPLFPTLENLPLLPEISPKDERELHIRRHFDAAMNVSPYYVEKVKRKAGGPAAEVERYSDRYKLKVKATRGPLSSVLKLAPAYFPVELLGQERNRGQGTKPSGTSQWTLQTSLAKNDLQRLDRLATLEQKLQNAGDDKDDGEVQDKKKKDGEEGDGDDDDGEKIDDEEEELGDDDYAQTFGFDDDDDYGDMDDGGDDEGAIF